MKKSITIFSVILALAITTMAHLPFIILAVQIIMIHTANAIIPTANNSEMTCCIPAFAADFKTRKLLYDRARFAVYEFSSAKGKFTAEFCFGSNGQWMLMNF